MSGSVVTIAIAFVALGLGGAALFDYLRVLEADRRAMRETTDIASRVRNTAKNRGLADLAPSERLAMVETLSQLPLRGYVRSLKAQQLLVRSNGADQVSVTASPVAEPPSWPRQPSPKPHVKRHLEKNGVDPNSLPDSVIETLNDFSEDELNAMDSLRASLEEAGMSFEAIFGSAR